MSTFSCRPANSAEGMSCSDPTIDTKVDRLLVGNSDQVEGPAARQTTDILTLEDAKAFLANAREPSTGAANDPNASKIADRVAAFLDKTDFTKEKLTFTVVDRQGDEGFVGVITSPGHVTIVFHTCSQMGGTPPPTSAFTAIYRVPRDAVVTQGGCGSCPQVECCPP